jgi:hypothetical protein
MKNQFNLLEKVKTYLSDSTTEFYLDMRYDLVPPDYANHFRELGQQLSIIDNLTSISDLVRKIDMEELVTPCAIVDADEILDETLENIIYEHFNCR